MPRYIGQLARCRRACPCAAVCTHSRPYKSLAHPLDGDFDPRVFKAVEGSKTWCLKGVIIIGRGCGVDVS